MDIAIITCVFGSDVRRAHAINMFLRKLLHQDANFRLYIADASSVSLCSAFTPWPLGYKTDRMRYKMSTNNYQLWQKEALLNNAAKKACKYHDKLIFMDCDIYCDNASWISEFAEKIYDNKVVQGFSFCFDTEDEDLQFQSVTSHYSTDIDSDLPLNPGLCWGMSADFYRAIGGLNPYFIVGGGDSGFVSEVLPHIPSVERIESLIRPNLPTGVSDYVSQEIFHVYHAPYKDKKYGKRHETYDSFVPSVSGLVRIGDNGLMEWKQT